MPGSQEGSSTEILPRHLAPFDPEAMTQLSHAVAVHQAAPRPQLHMNIAVQPLFLFLLLNDV